MSGKMDCFGQTDRGLKRENNQDQFLVADLNKAMRIHQSSLDLDDETTLSGHSQGQLLMVADGVGGSQAGAEASRLAVERVTRYMLNTMPWFYRLDPRDDEDFRQELREALQQAQNALTEQMRDRPECHGMGTTLTLAYMLWPRAYLVHVGDSRAYLYREGRLEQITTDHTIARQMVERGVLAESEVAGSRWSSVLWNVVGGHTNELLPDVYKVRLQVGDTLLLCSDGLNKHVSDKAIAELFEQRKSARECCAHLVDQALSGGGKDNITVIVTRFLDASDAVELEVLVEAEPSQIEEDLADTVPSFVLPDSKSVSVQEPVPDQAD